MPGRPSPSTAPSLALPLAQAAFPHPATDAQRACVELLGSLNVGITSRAVQLMAAGDARQLGALMCEAQAAFDARATPLCPSQLAAPVLHAVLAHPPIQSLVYGGKGVGSQVRRAAGRRDCMQASTSGAQRGLRQSSSCSLPSTAASLWRPAVQGDGTAQLLCRDAAAQAEVCRILEADLKVHCMPFTVPPTDGSAALAAGSVASAAAVGAAAIAAPSSNGGKAAAALLQEAVAVAAGKA